MGGLEVALDLLRGAVLGQLRQIAEGDPALIGVVLLADVLPLGRQVEIPFPHVFRVAALLQEAVCLQPGKHYRNGALGAVGQLSQLLRGDAGLLLNEAEGVDIHLTHVGPETVVPGQCLILIHQHIVAEDNVYLLLQMLKDAGIIAGFFCFVHIPISRASDAPMLRSRPASPRPPFWWPSWWRSG